MYNICINASIHMSPSRPQPRPGPRPPGFRETLSRHTRMEATGPTELKISYSMAWKHRGTLRKRRDVTQPRLLDGLGAGNLGDLGGVRLR